MKMSCHFIEENTFKKSNNGPDNKKDNENSKKGFRIDDILFSVASNVEKSLQLQVEAKIFNSSLSLSPASSCDLSNDESQHLSPVSFIRRPLPHTSGKIKSFGKILTREMTIKLFYHSRIVAMTHHRMKRQKNCFYHQVKFLIFLRHILVLQNNS